MAAKADTIVLITLKWYFQLQDEEKILLLFCFVFLKRVKGKEKFESRIVLLRKTQFLREIGIQEVDTW